MCGHKQIGIWEVSKITVVDSNDIVNHWLMTGAINIPTIIICGQGQRSEHVIPPPYRMFALRFVCIGLGRNKR